MRVLPIAHTRRMFSCLFRGQLGAKTPPADGPSTFGYLYLSEFCQSVDLGLIPVCYSEAAAKVRH